MKAESMTESYRTFHISGDVEPMSETLMGHIMAWHAKGSIEFRRHDRSVVELTRFRLPQIKNLMSRKSLGALAWS
jgi:hypothetical protein